MDWELELLEPLTIEVEFKKQGVTQYIASTWAGYVGVLTGMRPNSYSVSINYRATKSGTFWANIKNALTASWPIGFLVREILESTRDYKTAYGALSFSELIAPCYITVAGTHGNAVLITRSVSDQLHIWHLGVKGTIVQTNVDHFMQKSDPDSFDIMNSYSRRDFARKILAQYPPSKITAENLWALISSVPICNSITVYGTYMNPTTGVLETRIPSKLGFLPRKVGESEQKDHIVYVPHDKVSDSTFRTKEVQLVQCRVCHAFYNPHVNKLGVCFAHSKPWHSTFSDCNYLKCGFGLGTEIGKQHWGCCYMTDQSATTCSKPSKHESDDDPLNS